ncbi:MAG: 6-phosphogluconolactonase [Bacteroidales bacterium]
MEKRGMFTFPDVEALAGFASTLLVEELSNVPEGQFFNIALSGGQTPKKIFEYLSHLDRDVIPWEKLRFFWGDERCVSPEHEESNYLMTKRYLFEPLAIEEKQMVRIRGENDPEHEANRYARKLTEYIPFVNGLPCFDLILLGLGSDGHTASIFPDQIGLFHSNKLCAVVEHPDSGQKRVTLTGPVINNARTVVFLIAGSDKANRVEDVFEHKITAFPATLVNPTHGKLLVLYAL